MTREEELERENAALREALAGLAAGFDHVRNCRFCGEDDAAVCDGGGMEAVAAREHAALALRSAPQPPAKQPEGHKSVPNAGEGPAK